MQCGFCELLIPNAASSDVVTGAFNLRRLGSNYSRATSAVVVPPLFRRTAGDE
ncbi:hypothetical protein N8527_01285 [bacterium]|nr:hypothetical protein [bacterium]